MVIATSPGNHFKEHLTGMRHERDTAVVSALRILAFIVEYGNYRVFPLLYDVSLAPDEGGKSVELQ